MGRLSAWRSTTDIFREDQGVDMIKTYGCEMDKAHSEAVGLAGHYYHTAVQSKTYEEEPCQNLRLGNGQDLWGGYRLGGALLPFGRGDQGLDMIKTYGWEMDKDPTERL